MTKEQKNKKIYTLISVFASIFVYTGAILVYMYSGGWRVDIFKQQVHKTGVLTVESDPYLANLSIDNKSPIRTPRSTSLPIGEYEITVTKDGYVKWNKKIRIKEEKATNIHPWLIKEKIEKQNISSVTGKKYIQSWESQDKKKILILTSTQIENTINYEIWLYNIDTTFWDLSSNPKVILSFENTQEPNIQLLPSPAGTYWILKYIQNDLTTTYLLDITRTSTLKNLSVLNVNQFNSYTMTWAQNSNYLLFESEQDLISFDVEKQSRYLLIKKIEGLEYIWNTDDQGYFYILETNPEIQIDNIYAYILTQEEMDGSNPKILVKDLFFQKNKEYLLEYINNPSLLTSLAFTNSTASTRSVGKIKNITVNQNTGGIYINTEVASYWYNIKSKKYHLISPYNSELLLFAPDNSKLIYKDVQGYGVFTFLNLDNNPNVEIGSKKIANIQASQNTQILGWLSNSSYIYFVENNNIYISDKDGDNKILLLENSPEYLHHTITTSREYLLTISSAISPIDGSEYISIDKYIIH